MKTFDVIIVGGGPAGLMAAVGAGRAGARVLLVEKGDKLGRKLMISGGGRCNVTNAKEMDELLKNILGNPRFMYSAFAVFSNKDIIHFFEGLGIRLKEEDRGRMFPVTDSAKTVADALIRHVRSLGATFRLEAPVKKLLLHDGECRGIELVSGEQLLATTVIVAVGGCSVPKTGSTGDGYTWAKEAGHTIVEPYPTEVGITASNDWVMSQQLKGLSLQRIEQTLFDPHGKKLCCEAGDMIFTHFGLSGPATLRTSHYVSVAQRKWGKVPLSLTIDLFPEKHAQTVEQELSTQLQAEPRKLLKNALKGIAPDRLLPLLSKQADANESLQCANVSKETITKLAVVMKAFPVTVTGTLPLEQATVTGGGVNVKEINPKTMASKLIKGLFFAGEVMDVHAHTGGYNITVAFSSGFVAGLSAAQYSHQ